MRSLFIHLVVAMALYAPTGNAETGKRQSSCANSIKIGQSSNRDMTEIFKCVELRSELKRYIEDVARAEKQLDQSMQKMGSRTRACAENSEKHHNCMRRLSRSSKQRVEAAVNELRKQENKLQRNYEFLAKQHGRFRGVFRDYTSEALACQEKSMSACIQPLEGGPAFDCTGCMSQSSYKYWTVALNKASMPELVGASKEHQLLSKAYKEALVRVRRSIVGGYKAFGQLAGSEAELSKYELGLYSIEQNGQGTNADGLVYAGTTKDGRAFQIQCTEGECRALSSYNIAGVEEINGLVREYQSQRYGKLEEADKWLFTNDQNELATSDPALTELGIVGKDFKSPLTEADSWLRKYASDEEIDLNAKLVEHAELAKQDLIDRSHSSELKGANYWRAFDELNGNYGGVDRREVTGDLRQRIRDLQIRTETDGLDANEQIFRQQELEFAQLLKSAKGKETVTTIQQAMAESTFGPDGEAVVEELDRVFVIDGDNGARTKSMGLDILEHLPRARKEELFAKLGLAKDFKPIVPEVEEAKAIVAIESPDNKETELKLDPLAPLNLTGAKKDPPAAEERPNLAKTEIGLPERKTITIDGQEIPIPRPKPEFLDPLVAMKPTTGQVTRSQITNNDVPDFERATAAEFLGRWFDTKDANHSQEIATEIVRNCSNETDAFSRCVYTMASTFGAESNFLKGYPGNYAKQGADGIYRIYSPAGARGAMQIMPGSAKWMENIYGDGGCEGTTTSTNLKVRIDSDFCYNVATAYNHFKYQNERVGQVWGSAAQKAGYNWGPHRKTLNNNLDATTAWFTTGRRLPAETRRYLKVNSTFTNELADFMRDMENRHAKYILAIASGI